MAKTILDTTLSSYLVDYSLTSHNHALSGLTEKSYNSLTNTPNLSALTSSLSGANLWQKQGTTGIYLANINDNVGIGVDNTFGYKLYVLGNTIINGTLYVGGSTFRIGNYMGIGGVWCGLKAYEVEPGSDLYLATNYLPRVTVLNGGNVGIGTTIPTHKLSLSGNLSITGSITASGNVHVKNTLKTDYGVIKKYQLLNADTTLNESYHVVEINTNDFNFDITITLPPVSNNEGREYILKAHYDNNNIVIISADGSDTIDGSTSITLDANQGVSKTLIADTHNNWIIVNKNKE